MIAPVQDYELFRRATSVFRGIIHKKAMYVWIFFGLHVYQENVDNLVNVLLL